VIGISSWGPWGLAAEENLAFQLRDQRIFITEAGAKKLHSGYFFFAMENGPFIDDFPIKNSIYKGFSMAMLNNQRVWKITMFNG